MRVCIPSCSVSCKLAGWLVSHVCTCTCHMCILGMWGLWLAAKGQPTNALSQADSRARYDADFSTGQAQMIHCSGTAWAAATSIVQMRSQRMCPHQVMPA